MTDNQVSEGVTESMIEAGMVELLAIINGKGGGPRESVLSIYAAMQSARTPNGWEDISTADTNGRPVWVGNPHNLCVAYYHIGAWRNWFKGPRYENVKLGDAAFAPEEIWFEPTHWQPLPDPPSADLLTRLGDGER